MDADNRTHVVRIRCAACGRKLGRWDVHVRPRGTTVLPHGRPGTDAYGRATLVPEGEDDWWPRPARPGFRWNNRGKLDQADALDLTCSCRTSTFGRRRQFRISADGLARRLARLGWPEEVYL